MQRDEDDKPARADRRVIPEGRQAEQPARVQRDDERVMLRRDLACALRQKPGGIAPGQRQFGQPLDNEKAQKERRI